MNAPHTIQVGTAWHEAPGAQRILRGLNTSNCWLVKRLAFFGEDGQAWAAPEGARRRLDDIRTAAIERAFGVSEARAMGSTKEPFNEALCRAYLAFNESFPSISDVLEMTFAQREGREPRVLFKGLVQCDSAMIDALTGFEPIARAAESYCPQVQP